MGHNVTREFIESLASWCGGLSKKEPSFKSNWLKEVSFKANDNEDGLFWSNVL